MHRRRLHRPPHKIAVLLILALALQGCALNLGKISQDAQALNRQAIQASETLHDAQLLPDPLFRTINVALNKIAVAGLVFTKALELGAGAHAAIQGFRDAVQQARDSLASDLPMTSWRLLLLAPLEALVGLLDQALARTS